MRAKRTRGAGARTQVRTVGPDKFVRRAAARGALEGEAAMGMRVLQLGVGSVGEVTARTMAPDPDVSCVVLADVDERRLAEVAAKLPPDKVEMLPLDATDDRGAHPKPSPASTCASTP